MSHASTPFAGETIWIVGASSGIGEALAQYLSAQGATLVLSARRADALHRLNEQLGAKHTLLPLDVADAKAVNAAIQQLSQQASPLHRMVYLAAIYQPTAIAHIDPAFAAQLMQVNWLGAVHVTQALLPYFTQQGFGQMAFCASVAGYVGLPNGQPYSASKAALINWVESLAAEAPPCVDVKLINPGFVRTPMTDQNAFPMPMRIEAEEAARALAHGLRQKGLEITFPKRFTMLMKCLRSLPYALLIPLLRRL